jgi:protein-disulfide isomerase
MTDPTSVPHEADDPSGQTTVVGYPELAATTATTPSAPAKDADALRRQVRFLQVLVVACLVLLAFLSIGLATAFRSSSTQLDALTDKVSALGSVPAALPAAVPATTTPPPAQPTAQASAAGVPQLGPAAALADQSLVPAGADPTGAILIGNPKASTVIETYIDYQCPYCQRWEATFGQALAAKALAPDSDLLIKQYNLAFLGETAPTLVPAGASARAAAAAACVLDTDGVQVFSGFSQALFAKADPTEPPGQFTAKVLTDLADKAGASPAAVDCITAEKHVPFVAATTQSGFSRGVGGTPTVIINGRTLVNPFQDSELAQLAAPTS